jgi:hypothetical protein
MVGKPIEIKSGAKEVWLCDQDGDLSFYSLEGKLSQSKEISL